MATKLSNFLNSTLATGLDSAAVIATVEGPGVNIPLDSNTTGSFVKRMTPGAGILMSNHNGKGVNAGVKIDSSVIPTLTNTATMTNKTINLTNNTLTGTLAQFNAAISDGSITGTATEDTLTNKTLTAPIINLNGSNTGGTPGITGPGTISQISSLGLRDQTATGQDTFLASNSSTTLTADRTITLDVHNADRTIEMKGNLDISGDLITSGDDNITLTTTGATNVTLPTSGTIPNTAGTIQVARELESDRAFSLTGEITASAVQFDGTGNVALNTTIANKSQADSATTIVERDANADITARAFQTPYGEVIDSAGNWKGLATGFKGEQGDKGQKGELGTKGQKGEIGVKGAQGEKGQKGDTGAAGSNGSKGQKGEKGEIGDKGATGATGGTGATGAKGQKGEVGQKGATGQKGEKGQKGDKGQKGEVGDKGGTGEKGGTGDKGDKGDKGQPGQFGGKTVNYAFSTTTTDADPGSGNVRFNNATVANVTKFFIDDADTNGTDIQSFLRTIDDSTSTIKGHVRVANKLDASDFAIFTISGLTEATGYFKVDVAYVSGPGSFANTEDVIMTFARTGDAGEKGQKGATGATGTGTKGQKGEKGEVGAAGGDGAKGEVGDKGATGDKGETGSTGAKGATGGTGGSGAKGQKGEVGSTGGSGAKGQKGESGGTGGTGAKGDKGDKGDKGNTGATGGGGSKGQKGDKGDRASSIASTSAPASPGDGDFWFDDETGALYIYYNDGNSSQWVQFNQAVLADGSIGSAKFLSSTSLSVFNSSGTALRTIYGAGS